MTDKLKIISLCDGMSCGAMALEPWLDKQGYDFGISIYCEMNKLDEG